MCQHLPNFRRRPLALIFGFGCNRAHFASFPSPVPVLTNDLRTRSHLVLKHFGFPPFKPSTRVSQSSPPTHSAKPSHAATTSPGPASPSVQRDPTCRKSHPVLSVRPPFSCSLAAHRCNDTARSDRPTTIPLGQEPIRLNTTRHDTGPHTSTPTHPLSTRARMPTLDPAQPPQ